MKRILGECSICGGDVTVPDIFWSVVPPTPTCEKCGAIPRGFRRVIPMVPRRDPYKEKKEYKWEYTKPWNSEDDPYFYMGGK